MGTLGNGLITFTLAIFLVATSIYGDLPMPSHYLELLRPEHAYLFGFIQADGHLYQNPKLPNKGKLQIELSARDVDILQKFNAIIPVKTSIKSRVRTTNFSNGELKQTYTMTACDMAFRQELEALGIPHGRKSNTIAPPAVPFSEADYYRGIIDGDGSLGITAGNLPFVSLVTTSDQLMSGYLSFIKKSTGCTITANRNKRDGVYNIMITREGAQALAKVLYYEGCLALDRKIHKSVEVTGWVRPENSLKREFEMKKWSKEEDTYILLHPLNDSCHVLKRTPQSISMRLWRLKKKGASGNDLSKH